MAIHPILRFPDRRLRQKTRPVVDFDDALRKRLRDLEDTMYDAEGLGLAGPQLGLDRSLLVMDCAWKEGERNPIYVVNPEILSASEETEISSEGCLSIPDETIDVPRAVRLRVTYQDQEGITHEWDCEGLEARCLAHEIDHLQGRLIVDYVSPLKRQLISQRARKAKRANRTASRNR